MDDINPYESPRAENSPPAKSGDNGDSSIGLRAVAYVAGTAIGATLGGRLTAISHIRPKSGDMSGYNAGAFYGGLIGLVIAMIAAHFASKRINRPPSQRET